jgi:hypothetical protein
MSDPVQIDGQTIPGWIVAAGLDHDLEPELHIYQWDKLLGWIARADAFVAEHGGEDQHSLTEAMYETADSLA